MSNTKLKIISGMLKGRNVLFSHSNNLRPTTSFIRETLFNWIMNEIKHKNCLDLFAGSGILGIEALSRGAKHVTFIDINNESCKNIDNNLENFNLKNYQVIHTDSTKFSSFKTNFDVIFVDPPYNKTLLIGILNNLNDLNIINDNGYIYFEQNVEIVQSEIPNTFKIIKEKKSSNVFYYLAQYTI